MATKQVSDDLEGGDDEEAGVGEPAKGAAAKPSITTDDDGNVKVTHPEEETPATRKEKRAAWKRHEEDARNLREKVASLERQNSELHTTLVTRLATPMQGQQQTSGQPDPFAAYMSQLDERQEMIGTIYRTPGLTAEQQATYRKQYNDINRERDRALLVQAENNATERMKRERAQQSPDAGIVPIIQSEYPDVLGFKGAGGVNTAFNWANAKYQQLVNEGEPATMATIRKAMDEAASKFQIRQPARPAPTALEQQRLGGVSAQAGARSGSREVTLSTEQQRIARVSFPDMDENAAYAKLAELLRKQDREGSAA